MTAFTTSQLEKMPVEIDWEGPPEQGPGKRRWWIWVLSAAIIGGLALTCYLKGRQLYAWLLGPAVTEVTSQMRLFSVKRGELRIVVNEEGKLRTVNSTRVLPAYQGACKITWLIPEGTAVKKGDLLATFDNTQYEEQLRASTADMEESVRALTIAQEALTIQCKTAESAVAQAKSRMDESQVAYRVFREMEAPKRLAELDAAINEVKTKLVTAQKDLADTQHQVESETIAEEQQRQATEKELANRKETVAAFTKRLNAAGLERKSFRAYSYPQNLAVKKQGAENAGIEMEKARVEARSLVLQKEAELAKTSDRLKQLKENIKRIEKQIASLSIKAEIDGFVIYGDSNRPSSMYGDQRINVGTDWYAGNVLMTIPDPSAFEASVSIPETVRGWLTEGCPVTVVCDAVPGLTMQGKLKKIEKIARQGAFWEGGQNVFDGVVSIEKVDPRLITGMSARVEILAEMLPDVLQVPIEAVTNENGDAVCYVKGPTGMERRKVTVGKSSIHFVQIVQVLSEAEQVSLAPDREVLQKANPGAGPAGNLR